MEIQGPAESLSAVFSALSHGRRRGILRLLRDRTSPVGLQELATHLAADEHDKALVEVTPADVKDVSTGLVHAHLSKLEDAGLVTWNRRENTVTTTTHPALPDPKLRRILDTTQEGWDDVLAALAHRRRRIVLSVLAEHGGAMARADLATETIAREHDAPGEGQPTHTASELLVQLHHVHLPKLHRAGLVSYDAAEGTASYEGHPALEDEWLDARPHETPRAILPTARHSDAVWTIEGRDNVIARGQSLFEQAEDELFLMVTTDGLLEEGCIRRLEDAIDRGVDVYLGSQTPEVRDLVRTRVPEVVVWEPQMDWLNLPPEHEKVGRLVFADRSAIMLATLGEETNTGAPSETAITGAGENNPLVVLLRELLGSRLDHLDAQSPDFLSEIPL